ncbi:Sec7 guanine nucleotide exchange factor [Ceratobasidium sp. AG-Ba]|nr:Sec7 guanine nucleotide exchange factor [Ceratobasidium sp. AG-Ba]
MASLFRTNQPRSPQQPPPSSFKRTGPAAFANSLAVAVSSADRAHRRVSRTPDDFEAALRSEHTMVLQEGRDIGTLGHDAAGRPRSGSVASVRAQPAPARASTDTIAARRQTVSTPKHGPATPVVIPPTPATAAPDPDDDDDDEEYDARRRSMFRSPGTASSPDLATLVRKARDAREQAQDYLEPNAPADRVRTKSSTSSAFEFVESSPVQTPLKQPARDRALTSPDQTFDGSPRLRKSTRRLAKAEKVLGAHRTPVVNDASAAVASDIGEGRSDREGKRSMRNKTSAFFGKMLGSGSIRDKHHAGHSTPTTPTATQHQYSFPAPPVPAIPAEYRLNTQPSASSSHLDVPYTDSPASTPPLSNADPFNHTGSYPNPMPPSRHSKPLPPIFKQFPPVPVDDRSDSEDDVPLAAPGPVPRPKTSMDVAKKDAAQDRNATVTQRRPRPGPAFPRQSKDGRRRSMSVGDIDVQKLVMEARARAAERGEQPRSSGLAKHETLDSADLRSRETPPRASLEMRSARYEPDSELDDEDRTEEAHVPSTAQLPVAQASPIDQRRMSKRAQAVHAWSRDMELSRLVDGFGGTNLEERRPYSIRPHTGERSSSEGASGSGRVLGLGKPVSRAPPSPLAARRPSTTSVKSGSSSSMLAVPGRFPHSSGSSQAPALVSQPSMESMRTVSSETAGAYITPPSSGILEFNSAISSGASSNGGTGSRPVPVSASSSSTPTTSGPPTASADQSVVGPGSTSSLVPLTPLSASLPPRSASLRLSPRALPRRQPPRHRSAASASEPSLVDPTGNGGVTAASVRLVSDQLPARPTGMAATAIHEQRLASDPVIPVSNWVDDDMGASTSRVDRRGSLGGASMDIEGRGQSLAARCWQEDESFLAKEKIAEWLGGTPAINKVALRYYMDYFDFSAMRLDSAFRHLCTKLYLKAETQQVDRILEEFSRRFWDCNRGSVYGSPSIVHAISYSLLLLNTDLHIAELSSHMSKAQFVRNTWAVIQDQIRSVEPTAPRSPMSGSQTLSSGNASGILAQATPSSSIDPLRSPMSQEQIRSQGYLPGESTPELVLDDEGSQHGDPREPVTRTQRSGSLNSWRSGSKETVPMTLNASSPSVTMEGSDPKTPTGSMYQVVFAKGWDSEMEMLLKDMYTAVKNQQILQPLTGLTAAERQSLSLSPGTAGIGRTRSQRGQVPPGGDRISSLKRGSIRGLQSLLGSQNPYGSNSSVDGRISPSPSFATSIGDGVQTTAANHFAPTLGFASNLSHTIIKEAQEDDVKSVNSDMTNSTTLSITDEELALLGPPWAKEGMLCRKQYWESAGKRAKAKNWMDVFVVIQKGELSMFVFGESHSNSGGSNVGGGNWLSNANCVGKVVLAHALAHSLPPPGYNRQRPHCFVLTLASGAVFFFQAGTEDLVNEWVMTCNYWAARQSKEPLSGGVSNMEYGWNRALELLQTSKDGLQDNNVDASDSRSIRSTRAVRVPPSPYNGDRLVIYEWTGPMHSVMPSTHDEETQMEALQKQANLLKQELLVHNELRQPMMSLYSARSANANKASNNWERRSQYLLSEIVKYDSYVESLRSAMSQRLKRRGEKALERALGVSSPDEEELEGVVYGAPSITGTGPSGRHELQPNTMRRPVRQVILEDDEPTTPSAGLNNFTTHH